MQTTVRTSELMSERVRQVPNRVDLISNAIINKDFDSFATHTMKVSVFMKSNTDFSAFAVSKQ